MRITISIDENVLDELQKSTGEHKKSPAVEKALELYLRDIRKRCLIEKVLKGKTDYRMSNEALELQGEYDAH